MIPGLRVDIPIEVGKPRASGDDPAEGYVVLPENW